MCIVICLCYFTAHLSSFICISAVFLCHKSLKNGNECNYNSICVKLAQEGKRLFLKINFGQCDKTNVSVCVSYSKQVLAEVMAVLNCYCPHESGGFNLFPQVDNSPFKTNGACITHLCNLVKLSSWRQ